MPKTSDIKQTKALMSLFTGKPGSRKTCAAASYPGPVFIFDFDGRVAPIRKMFPDRDDIEYETYQNNWDKAYKLMMDIQDDPDGYPFKTYIADSLTNIAESLIRYSKKIRGAGGGNMSRGVMSLTDITDYNYETTGLSDLCSFLKIMNEKHQKHVILTAHILEYEKQVSGQAIGTTETVSQLLTAGKKVAPKIPSIFDEMYYFQPEGGFGESKSKAYTDTYGPYSAKTALPLPFEIDFTNRSFFEVLCGHLSSQGIELDK